MVNDFWFMGLSEVILYREGLILNLNWICFCSFNPFLSLDTDIMACLSEISWAAHLWRTVRKGYWHIPLPEAGEGDGTPLQYSCLENPMDGGAWWAAVHGVTKSRTWLSDLPFTFHFHALEKEMATHSSVLAWRIPGMREPGGLPSMGSHRVGDDWSDLAAVAAALTAAPINFDSPVVSHQQNLDNIYWASYSDHKESTRQRWHAELHSISKECDLFSQLRGLWGCEHHYT